MWLLYTYVLYVCMHSHVCYNNREWMVLWRKGVYMIYCA